MQYEKVKDYLEDARLNGSIVAGGDIEDRRLLRSPHDCPRHFRWRAHC